MSQSSANVGTFTLVFIERCSAFLRPVHVAKRCVTLFLDVLLRVLHLGPSSWRVAWLVFFGYALLSHPVPWLKQRVVGQLQLPGFQVHAAHLTNMVLQQRYIPEHHIIISMEVFHELVPAWRMLHSSTSALGRDQTDEHCPSNHMTCENVHVVPYRHAHGHPHNTHTRNTQRNTHTLDTAAVSLSACLLLFPYRLLRGESGVARCVVNSSAASFCCSATCSASVGQACVALHARHSLRSGSSPRLQSDWQGCALSTLVHAALAASCSMTSSVDARFELKVSCCWIVARCTVWAVATTHFQTEWTEPPRARSQRAQRHASATSPHTSWLWQRTCH